MGTCLLGAKAGTGEVLQVSPQPHFPSLLAPPSPLPSLPTAALPSVHFTRPIHVRSAQLKASCGSCKGICLGEGSCVLTAPRLQVSLNGRGPIGRMTAVATDAGQVKGFVANPECDPPLNARGKASPLSLTP